MKMWGDKKFLKLTQPQPNGQSLWIALIAGRQTINIPGLLVTGEAGFAENLDWPLEGFRQAFRELSVNTMVEADWKSRVVWIPKAIEYNKPESPNVVRSWKDTWDEIPECPLKTKAHHELKAFMAALGEAFLKAFEEACGKPYLKAMANQEQEQEQEQDLIIPPTEDETNSFILQGQLPTRTHLRLEFFIEEYFLSKSRKYIVGNFKEEGGAAKRTLQKIPDDNVYRKAVRAYLASTEKRLVENGHPFMWFIRELNRWATQAQGDTHVSEKFGKYEHVCE